MGKNTPEAPNYAAAAQTTAASNRQATESQTAANRPNQYTPFGSSTWTSDQTFNQEAYDRAMADWQRQYGSQTGGSPIDVFLGRGGQLSEEARSMMPTRNDYYTTNWTQNTELDPALQGALDSQLQLQQGRSDLANSLFPRAQEEFGTAMDWSGFTPFSMAPETSQVGQGLTGFAAAPQARSYGEGLTPFSFGPQQSQYSPEDIQRSIGDSPGYVQRAEDAIYNQWSGRQEPRMQQQMSQLETQLRNQGMKPGDEAYDSAVQRLRQDQDDARTQAQYQATIGSGAEGSRLQGMDLNAGNFRNQASQQSLEQQFGIGDRNFYQGADSADRANQIRAQQMGEQFGIGDRGYAQDAQTAAYINALRGQQLGEQMDIGNMQFSQGMARANQNNTVRQQQIAEEMQRRGFSLNEINAIISGQQVGMPSMPSFNAAGNSGGTNYSGAARDQYSAELDAFNAQNAALQGLMGGAAGLGSAFFPFGFGG